MDCGYPSTITEVPSRWQILAMDNVSDLRISDGGWIGRVEHKRGK